MDFSFSPRIWLFLELLQLDLAVTFEVVDPTLRPVRAGGLFAGAVEEPGVRERALDALRTGETVLATSATVPYGIFPLRRERDVVGLLVVTPTARQPEAVEGAPRHIHSAGQVARAALEADLLLSAQLGQARARARRLHGVLRFLTRLTAGEGEREVMHAVVQAATVWFDLDCRIYKRAPDGDFVLFAVLPGGEPGEAALRIGARRAAQLSALRRVPGAAEFDDLDWHMRGGEALVMPVAGRTSEWLMLLGGAIDAEVELTFGAIAHVLAGELYRIESDRIAGWRTRLAAAQVEAEREPERILLMLLQELAHDVGAADARLSLEKDGTTRTLARIGTNADLQRATAERAPHHELFLSEPVRIGPDAHVHLELAPGVRAFGSAELANIHAWLAALEPWLWGAARELQHERQLEDTVESAAFEERVEEEVERARRFNLGLALLVVSAEKPTPDRPAAVAEVMEATRPELRASDLSGRLRGNLMAVLLVHSSSGAANSVATRIERRLLDMFAQQPSPPFRLGKAVFSAECPSAEALIETAVRDLQEVGSRK